MTFYLCGLACRLSPAKQLCLNSFPLLLSIRNETHYDVLRLPRSCTTKEIREAFISLSKENHPDKHQNDPSMHIRFVKINEAYRTLSKPSTRHAYDITLGSKRKLGPTPIRVYRQDFTSSGPHQHHEFHDPFMWHNVKSDGKHSEDNYYGIKGIKKVSNTVIVWLIVAFTVVGAIAQFFIIRVTYHYIFFRARGEADGFRDLYILRFTARRRNEYMLEESRKNSLLESMLKERAKLYGNEHQIQVLKNSLRASYSLDSDSDSEASQPEKGPR